jgi:tRNA(Ile2) C34 agmatinyltransferase TiaS
MEDDYESCITDEEVNSYFNRRLAATNRADRKRYICPSCGNKCLSAYQHERGYRCDSCADRAESGKEY